ncbi:MAG: hypothetical protein EA396_10310 [Anaerolineaceae bacterium]|nr:MAG: hypothetical protein EA396_10310 [Anaerolineaceae bacterium]
MKNTTTRRKLIISAVLLILLGGGLALDLTYRGAFWRMAWSVTGREDAVGQLRGVVQYAGNWLRPQPRVDRMTAVDHANVPPYGINTFLEQEVDPQKVEAALQMIGEAGFHWIRQQFIWADIEISGKGDFIDARHDLTGDGQIDAISAWEKYDRIVDGAQANGLRIQARLDAPPAWSRALPEEEAGAFAPPDDFQDYVDYAVAVAERYLGRIWHYQIWNEPNIFPEWGNAPVDPEAYTRMLCMTHDALKAVHPDIVVIAGALAPTQSLTSRDLNDYIFLQRMYQAGAGDCFDVLSMQGYGLRSGPTDRRMRPTLVNISRNLYIRDLMIANGDAHKPIWISEAAWNFVPSADEAPDIAEPRDLYGQVSMEQAADYIVRLYERVEQEWPWMGVVNYWFFTRRSDDERDQPFYYFRMVEPYFDAQADPPFPPLPVYHALRDHMQNTAPTLHAGVHLMASAHDAHWAVTFPPEASRERLPAATSGHAMRTTGATMRVHGTDVLLRWQGVETIRVNGETVDGLAVGGWYSARLHLSATAQPHAIDITAEAPILLESVTVLADGWRHAFAWIAGGLVALIALGVALYDALALRRRRRA